MFALRPSFKYFNNGSRGKRIKRSTGKYGNRPSSQWKAVSKVYLAATHSSEARSAVIEIKCVYSREYNSTKIKAYRPIALIGVGCSA